MKAKFLVTHQYYTKNEAEKEDDNALANLTLISVQNKLEKVVDKWNQALWHSTPAEMDHCTYPF